MISIVYVFLFCVVSCDSFEMKQICESPRVYLVENFLTALECDYVIEKASPELERSTVLGEEEAGEIDDRRTSQGMFFPSNPSSLILRSIERKIAEMTKIPIANGEGLQVLHYDEGGEYQPHYDYFTPSMPGGAETLKRGGQRVVSFLIYLNTPEEGGETLFPRANIRVTPKKGNAIFFYNVTPDGKVDPCSFHGGAPVIKGEKWIVTKWLREGVFR